MNLSKITSAAVILSLAGTVTAGTMYVTLNAASIQEDAELPVPPAPVVDADLESDLLHGRSQDIVLDAEGRFSGRISTVAGSDGQLQSVGKCSVTLVSRGRKVASVDTDDAGLFAFSGLKPGVYGLVAKGADAYLVYAFRALAPTAAGVATVESEQASTVSVELQMNTITVFKRDFAAVADLIKREIPAEFRRRQRLGVPNASKDGFDPRTQGQVHGEGQFASTVTFAGLLTFGFKGQVHGEGQFASTIASHQVQLKPDGSLVGEINLLENEDGYFQEIRDLRVYFIMDNKIMGSADVNRNGIFRVLGLTPGLYSAVAVGDDGVLAVGVDVLGSFAAANPENTEDYQYASVAQFLDFAAAPVDLENFASINQPPADGSESPAAPEGFVQAPGPLGGTGGGGATGGGGGATGGGGGGAGGGGGLGAAAAPLAGGALGYFLSDNSNDPNAS